MTSVYFYIFLPDVELSLYLISKDDNIVLFISDLVSFYPTNTENKMPIL